MYFSQTVTRQFFKHWRTFLTKKVTVHCGNHPALGNIETNEVFKKRCSALYWTEEVLQKKIHLMK